MKLHEIIELNGKEYTLELNRQSFLQIDKICNIKKIMAVLQESLYKYVEEIDDDYNPFEEEIDETKFIDMQQKQDKELFKFVERSLFVWLYPNHKLTISQVREMLKPYFEDNSQEGIDKFNTLLEKVLDCIERCNSVKSDLKNE